MNLPDFIKEKEEMLREIVCCIDYSQEEKESEATLLLTQAIKESVALGIERAIEVAEGMKKVSPYFLPQKYNPENHAHNTALTELTAALQKELSSIRDNS